MSETSELVYLALLDCADGDYRHLVEHLDLTEREVVVALDELTKLALLQAGDAGRRLLRPVDPEVGVAALIARRQAEIARRQQEVEESKLAFARLLSRHSESGAKSADSGVEHLMGLTAIRRRLREIAESCEREACSFMPGGAAFAEGLPVTRFLDCEAIDRGVRLRTIYHDSIRNHPPAVEYARRLSDLGSEVRTAPSLPLRMFVVDRRIAVVPVDDDDADSAVVVSIGGVASALHTLFASVWRTSTPLGPPRPRAADGLTDQGREALKLLGKGCTDEVIARRLGVSVRTARRVASGLLARLDARSRFQAGARAVARGWVDIDDLD
ncbi:helix-turn-helix transcriptional regulator [Actinokineospora auranticolor]|uniref:helix-turn-helix domain-containing protein n=1 Tax=Actinokineospora auranticolor TaxID=155976 RepID=UPI001CA558E0|nr:helix-turn-helix transcriptional regulator [Actinokineospora auranticolor]